MSSLNELSITEASKKLATGEITSVQLVEACLAEIEKRNSSLNAFLEVFSDAKEQAQKADERRAAGESHPLLGIPLAIKDNILIEGRKASAASKMLQNYIATYDATVIKKLKEAGAVFLGRTNMDEFALGGSTENSAYGVTKNPHDEKRVAGGTSGGSAAAVASGMALGALGSDTGGSVRNPASFCGVVGLKPTYGAVSRSGLIAAVSSFDQIGPITKTVEDAELIFNTIRGQDPLDSTSIGMENIKLQISNNKNIGVPRKLLGKGVEPEVLAQFEHSLEKLKAQGCEVVDIALPALDYALSAYYIINFAEVSTNLSRFDGVRYGLSLKGESLFDDYATTRGEGFGAEARRRIMLGTYVLSAGYYDAYYGKATAARVQLRKEFEDAFKSVDFIATPTMPYPAWKVGEKSDPLAAYLADIFTVTANLTGNPAISIPMGTVEREGKQLPVGLQLTAAHGDEAALFAAGKLLY
ncbi:glutaminyl-tRNA synthase (glutamine-hydrolyzing) subunit A [Candidatus Kaiserbacteria bacterium RIFCSPLOWO2_01_FULL_54_20]|uniref:Glutamyl-tRNA(Gln) amidotransferase subunit A n=1 Tax=Candidatus Kaiserbacteria bacterium RIFCSPLOWO2_01_FULL_54_20 TaxID=1798513 RepID=A0A1F6EIF3_9BACT|nr:MAG: glutaminyl-tRNA synthase (glutamine-hydrolyzing) subunit A [Candidatus Kaiserbacteria bacterium RIFCSPLOWO2_01_FULL_54_20]